MASCVTNSILLLIVRRPAGGQLENLRLFNWGTWSIEGTTASEF